AAAAVATAAAWFLPFVALSPAGVGHAFHSQFARPLQLESLAGSLLIAAHEAAGTTLHVTSSFGSQNLSGPGTHAAAVATTIAVVALLFVLVWPRSQHELLGEHRSRLEALQRVRTQVQ